MGWDALGSQFVESLFTGRRSPSICCREDTQMLSAQPVNSHTWSKLLPKKVWRCDVQEGELGI